MAIRGRIVACEVDGGSAELVVNIAGKVPIEVPLDGRIRRFGDERLAVLVYDLEHERNIRACNMPVAFEKWIRLAIENTAGLRMFELREVVVITMNDDGCILNLTGMESIGRRPADCYGEAKGEESNAGHEDSNDRQEPNFLTPGTLLLGCADS